MDKLKIGSTVFAVPKTLVEGSKILKAKVSTFAIRQGKVVPIIVAMGRNPIEYVVSGYDFFTKQDEAIERLREFNH